MRFCFALLLWFPVCAQNQPSLSQAISSLGNGPGWVAFPMETRDHDQSARNGWRTRSCDLTSQWHGDEWSGGRISVFAKVDSGKVVQIRLCQADLPVNSGGQRVQWSAPDANERLQWLAGLVESQQSEGRSGLWDAALLLIAAHREPQAIALLARYTEQQRPVELKKKAIFWAAVEQERPGFQLVERVIRNDTDDHFRAEAVFALSQTKQPESIPALIELAEHDRSERVRRQAMFWLSQKAGVKAADTLARATESDPDAGVKKHAVFALSQLPPDEGLPRLFEVFRSSKSPEVRQAAAFWIGQSNDQRAVRFLREVLSN